MGDIYLISDTHFGHSNIIKYCNRPFKTVEEMNETIIDNWNHTVRKDDKVYFLGDFSFYNLDVTKTIVSKLRGIKAIVMGNHDRSRSHKWFINAGFHEVSKYPIIYNNYIMSHEPIRFKCDLINIHGHVHNSVTDLDPRKYINVSADVLNFTPLNLNLLRI